MNEIQKTILKLIEEYWSKNPSLRFGQVLFNLGITEFANKTDPESEKFQLRDIYNDTDEKILNRINI